ncbi:MAG: tyrosine-type recombinase/integrase [Spirochaetaceae bacterium]|nr:tyrosine-type recombinase/integrase [Spirochaetaceae bacterium]
MAPDDDMLSDHVDRYLALRRTLGYKLHDTGRNLQAFAAFAGDKGDTHIRAATAVQWAAQASTPHARAVRLHDVVVLARFLFAEDATHEIPPARHFHVRVVRQPPYIYTPTEIGQLLAAARRLPCSYALRRSVYATLIGLIAATGLRVSEALDLRFDDLLPNSVLCIRRTKFAKSRLVPLHPTTVEALTEYLHERQSVAIADDHLFVSAHHRRIPTPTASGTFQRVVRLAGIAVGRQRRPRMVDLRHTFATRSLQRCAVRRESVARHLVALSTYLGHTNVVHTYWYLEATPELMADIATTGENFVSGRLA